MQWDTLSTKKLSPKVICSKTSDPVKSAPSVWKSVGILILVVVAKTRLALEWWRIKDYTKTNSFTFVHIWSSLIVAYTVQSTLMDPKLTITIGKSAISGQQSDYFWRLFWLKFIIEKCCVVCQWWSNRRILLRTHNQDPVIMVLVLPSSFWMEFSILVHCDLWQSA